MEVVWVSRRVPGSRLLRKLQQLNSFFFFFLRNCLFIFGCDGSSSLRAGFL